MKRKASHELEECLALLEQGQITLQECLDRYPDHAEELGVMIPIALEAGRVSLPSPSAAALETWGRQMFAALDKKEQRPTSLRVSRRTLPLRRIAYAAILLLIVLFTGTYMYFGGGTTTAQAATLTGVSGSVQVLFAGGAAWEPATAGQEVNVGDRIRVGALSAAALSFPGGCSTDLEAGTDVDLLQISIQRNGSGGTVVLHQRLGQTRTCVQPSPGYESRFEIRTPSASVIARGTRFTVIVGGDGATDVAVAEGVVEVMNQALSVLVRTGEGTSVEPERPPVPVYTVPAVTQEPVVTPESEEPAEYETPEPAEHQEIREPEEQESPEPPEVEETEEPAELETPEESEEPAEQETREEPESDETEQPDEHKADEPEDKE